MENARLNPFLDVLFSPQESTELTNCYLLLFHIWRVWFCPEAWKILNFPKSNNEPPLSVKTHRWAWKVIFCQRGQIRFCKFTKRFSFFLVYVYIVFIVKVVQIQLKKYICVSTDKNMMKPMEKRKSLVECTLILDAHRKNS